MPSFSYLVGTRARVFFLLENVQVTYYNRIMPDVLNPPNRKLSKEE